MHYGLLGNLPTDMANWATSRWVTLRDCLSNDTVLNCCKKQPTVNNHIQWNCLQWFGTACDMDDSHLPKCLLHITLW